MVEKKRVVILGAGFGGLLTALTLARKNYNGEIVLVDVRDHHTYSPWLYEVATGFISHGGALAGIIMRNSASFSIREIIKPYQQLRFRQGLVNALEIHDQYVVFEDGHTLRYDQLVVSLGSEPEFYNIEGIADHALMLKTVPEALMVRDRIDDLVKKLENSEYKLGRIVIGGAGATGVETASELVNSINCHCEKLKLCHGKIEVTLLEAGPNVLGPFPSVLQKWALKRMIELGVNVQTNTVITKVESDNLITKEGNIPFDLCIWTGGVRPNSILSTWGIPKDARGRIIVDEYLKVTGLENVYALGDNTAFTDKNTDKLAPGTAWVAMRQGKLLGDNLSRLSLGQLLKPFNLPKHYPAVMAVGGKFAVATVGGFHFKNVIAFFLRQVIDLHYFLAIFPFWRALKFWWQGTKVFEKND